VAGGSEAPATLRAKALAAASILACMQGEAGRGEALAQKAVVLAEQSGDREGRVFALLMLSFAARSRGEHGASAARAETAAEQVRALADDEIPPFLRPFVLNCVGHEAYELGDCSRAEVILKEALERWRRLGAPLGDRHSPGEAGDIAQARGDEAGAGALYRESLEYWQSQGELGAVEILTGVARLATREQPEAGRRHPGTVPARQERPGTGQGPGVPRRERHSSS
jgi:hypothetical protein